MGNDFISKTLQACRIASSEHHTQVRRGSGLPYVTHPMRVAQKIADGIGLPDSVNLETAILAAILHDTLEDTALSEKRISDTFGAEVLNTVKELTQDKSLEKAARRQKMLEGCKNYSLTAKVVKLADRWDNMSEMDEMSAAFKERYCHEARIMLKNMSGAWPQAEAAISQLIQQHQSPSEASPQDRDQSR